MKLKLTLVVFVLALLNACSFGDDLEYLQAQTSANLEIPPDLTQSVSTSRFEIPDNISSGTGETVNKIPVLAQVDSLRLEGSADLYWLTIDGPVDNLYQLVRNYWASEGYGLTVDEPVIGVMQTEWILKEEGKGAADQGFLASLFGEDNLSATQDQFHTRIARDPETSSTRIYIAHRGTRYLHKLVTRQTEEEDQNEWGYRQPEPELEVEMLSRLMIYLGLNKAEVDQQLVNVKLFAPRATIHIDVSENETFIIVKSARQLAWNRLLHQLDRLNFDIVSTDPSSGLGGDGVVFLKIASEAEEDNGEKQVTLVVTDETHELTRISLENADGDIDESPEGAELIALLYEYIK